MDTGKMYITDDNGNELEANILFTFENDHYGKQYVLYQAPDNPEEVYVSSYDDEGNLTEVEDPEEFAMVEEVLGAFIDAQDEEE